MNKNELNLVEYIHPKMDILFVALNAPEVSNNNKHWFSRNFSFWNLLFSAGLITQQILDAKEGDISVFGSNSINYHRWIFGVTDLNRDMVQTNSNNVITNTGQVLRILDIIKTKKVKKLCLMHSKVAKEFQNNELIDRSKGYGIVGKICDTIVYEVPFHNASIPNKQKYYALLKEIAGDDNQDETISIDSINIVAERINVSESNIDLNELPSKENEPSKSIIEESTVKKINPILKGNSFQLPDFGNEITQADVNKEQVRITAGFKSYFPSSDQKLTILYKGQEYITSFLHKGRRSHLLVLGQILMSKIGIKAGSSITMRKINTLEFEILQVK